MLLLKKSSFRMLRYIKIYVIIVPERERAERICVRMERQRIRIAEQRGLLSPKGQLSESVEREANSRQAEGLIRRREGGGVGKPKCRYMRVSKTAHHPDTKIQGGEGNE